MADDLLFHSLRLGSLDLPNRVLMAPLTRSRSKQPGDVPWALNAEYYAQREHEQAAHPSHEHDDGTVHEHGESKEHDYGDLGTRAEILRVARKAHREADNAEAASFLEQAIHLAGTNPSTYPLCTTASNGRSARRLGCSRDGM